MKRVYLALGSNIGKRELCLQQALKKLQKRDLRLRRVSSLYETEPVGLRDQPWFLNQVAEFETELHPMQLLRRIHLVEKALGRRRLVVNGPRTIDIDIVLYDKAVMKSPELEIPHPRYRERLFVLEPLAELDPTLEDPETGESVTVMRAAVSGQNIQRRQ